VEEDAAATEFRVVVLAAVAVCEELERDTATAVVDLSAFVAVDTLITDVVVESTAAPLPGSDDWISLIA
jgi:hypothetical protein